MKSPALLRPVGLRVEYLKDPRGIDASPPRLQWRLEGDGRGRMQRAYQVEVASARERLEDGAADRWDSGRVDGAQSLQVPYGGGALGSGMLCWWRVRVWDELDRVGPWSEPAFWSMGLLSPQDWQADWIGLPMPRPDCSGEEPVTMEGCAWFVHPEDLDVGLEPDVTSYFRREAPIPNGKRLVRVSTYMAGGDEYTLHLNGQRIYHEPGRFGCWFRPRRADLLCDEKGVACFAIVNECDAGLPGLAGRILCEYDDGSQSSLDIDSGWRAGRVPEKGWDRPGFEDGSWACAVKRAELDEEPYGPFHMPNGEVFLPSPYLRHDFGLPAAPLRATAYVTALGVCDLHINGNAVSNDVLAPGWSDFAKRVYYRTYDVTEHCTEGVNAVGIVLGHGWYSGYLGWDGSRRGHYGEETPWARVRIELEYADGRKDAVTTNSGWKGAFGPIVGSDIYMGEQYDARREMPGWDRPGFDDSKWQASAVRPESPEIALESYRVEPKRRVKEIVPVSKSYSPEGAPIFDLGQNIVGWVRLSMHGEAGAKATLRFAEMLEEDGSLYVKNLRGARCIDEYWLKGGEEEVFEPRFTFHGFRYVEVGGLGDLSLDAVTGIVVHNDMLHVGAFQCGNGMVNRLQHNIEWGQRGNYLEVPTDCPQRDERLGWMGDAQVFIRTGAFNFDVAAFFTKWMRDVLDAQFENGAFSDVSPTVANLTGAGSPAWADAGIIVPWTLYLCYADTRIIDECWEGMERYMAYIHGANPNHLWKQQRGSDFGDWLATQEGTPKDLIGTAFWAYDCDLMARMAEVTGKGDRAAHYRALQMAVKNAFNEEYVGPDGSVAGNTQTAYVLALHFELVPEALRPMVLNHLVEDIASRGGHLGTGFVGCSYLPFALSRHGRGDVSYRLLLNTTYPSWGYPVLNGATTIWERWDGWTDTGGWQSASMNSFNHYAYGSIGEWMYRVAAGIDIDPAEPAYAHILLKPLVSRALGHAGASIESPRGRVSCAWRIRDARVDVEVEIPPNSRATLTLPAERVASVLEGSTPLDEAVGVEILGRNPGSLEIGLGSGVYSFECSSAL